MPFQISFTKIIFLKDIPKRLNGYWSKDLAPSQRNHNSPLTLTAFLTPPRTPPHSCTRPDSRDKRRNLQGLPWNVDEDMDA